MGDYGDEWLLSLADVKDRTRRGYAQPLDNHVRPVFGDVALRDVRRSDAEDFRRALQAKGLTPPTMKQAFRVLQRTLDRAVLNRAIPYNPCDGVKLPTDVSTGRRKPQPQFLSASQVDRLAQVLDAEPPYGLLLRFMAYTGLHAGEVAGLNVEDVQLRRVYVHRTRTKVPGVPEGSTGRKHAAWDPRGYVEGTPKTPNSTRHVPLPEWLASALAHYLAEEHPRGSDPAAPLWPARRRGGYTHGQRADGSAGRNDLDWSTPWDRGAFYRGHFKPALRKADLPATVRLHDLRHTYASLCASTGMDHLKISRRMGHRNVATTLDIYTHLFHADDDADMALLDRLMPGGSYGVPATVHTLDRSHA